VSVSVIETRAAWIVLTVQLATVWFTLRTSHARRLVWLCSPLSDYVTGPMIPVNGGARGMS
jgi:hypothetical protein